MSKTYLATFGNQHFRIRKEKLSEEAKQSGWFDDIFVYDNEFLLSEHFWNTNGYDYNFRGVGGGWWRWHPLALQTSLNRMEFGDVLLWLDAGIYINKYGTEHFKHLLNCTENYDIVTWPLNDTPEKINTKRDVFMLLDCDTPEYTDTDQIASGIMFIKKTYKSMFFINEYVKLSKVVHLWDTHPSINPECDGFRGHKHNQSVISVLIKKIYGDDIGKNIMTDIKNVYNENYNEIAEKFIACINKKNNDYENWIHEVKTFFIVARITDEYYGANKYY